MSKPIERIKVTTLDGKNFYVKALFDTGAFYTLIRQDFVPAHTSIEKYRRPALFTTAARQGNVKAIGELGLILAIAGKMIKTTAMVTVDLKREFILGAMTMQEWDIDILNKNGKTKIRIGRDMRDPEITEVD
ncbi:MAG: hypothetical protein HY747_01880 [Elusimicrobia bacterium]|nr:hypothetical protein [Elusimicrobiota bacterium]